MKSATQHFTVHPVGQGLFYSGNIELNADNDTPSSFKFVFDCGSLNTSNILEEIDIYKGRYFPNDNTRLGLLVISHFDKDHVSHIHKILEGGRKVDNIVLPFCLPEERLSIVLKEYNTLKGYSAPDGPAADMALDPIGALSGNIDERTRIFFIGSDNDSKPFPPPNKESGPDSGSSHDGDGMRFDILGAQRVEDQDIHTLPFAIPSNFDGQIYTALDSNKGNLTVGRHTRLMEFLFYRKDIGADQVAFFNEIFLEFCKLKNVPVTTEGKPVVFDDFVTAVKGTSAATAIKKIFKAAYKKYPDLIVSESDAIDMNTTALAMLHSNLPSLYQAFDISDYDNFNHRHNHEIYTIRKFRGNNSTRIEECNYDLKYYHPYYYHRFTKQTAFPYPNCLLTSDLFLLNAGDVQQFYNKYQNYWDSFWLFQIPHHGSKSNAGLPLLNRLPYQLTKFINYGTVFPKSEKWKHPSSELIQNLTAAGQASRVLPINEFTGLRFILNLAKP